MAKEFCVETYLFCEDCLEDTLHKATYRDGEIIKLTCLECENEIMLNRPVRQKRQSNKSMFDFFPFNLLNRTYKKS